MKSTISLPRLILGLLPVLALLLSGCMSAPELETAPTSPPPPTAVPTSPPAPSEPAVSEDTSAASEDTPAMPESVSEVDIREIGLELELLAADLQRPVFLTHAGDASGRLFIVEQPGRILIWQEGEVRPEPFLDITDRVRDVDNEQGLLGLAFAPDYLKTLQFYVNYTARNGATVISRFQASPVNPDQALRDSEELILEVSQPAANHNGGMLLFGPDQMLYIGLGDGGAANDLFGNGQNPDSLLGKMLRLDVLTPGPRPYTVPTDNPWVDRTWNGRPVRPEVWGLGLRNPWRYSFDAVTGDLWIGDVGQNAFEEVHFVPIEIQHAPLNFGWPLMEGLHCFPAHTDCDREGLNLPVAEFPQGMGECSVTGGYVYRGGRTPALQGRYVVGDYCSGRIWLVWNEGARQDPQWRQTELADTDLNISSFGEDGTGELYVLDLEGSIYRMHFQAP